MHEPDATTPAIVWDSLSCSHPVPYSIRPERFRMPDCGFLPSSRLSSILSANISGGIPLPIKQSPDTQTDQPGLL